jgi:hypothetical protein
VTLVVVPVAYDLFEEHKEKRKMKKELSGVQP